QLARGNGQEKLGDSAPNCDDNFAPKAIDRIEFVSCDRRIFLRDRRTARPLTPDTSGRKSGADTN
ncbi:MAG TPA: hypothetical protein DIT76_01395, partial [Spartobacteria bacterium]|nr:hypothetical protein [Spartobacteria bacterium]